MILMSFAIISIACQQMWTLFRCFRFNSKGFSEFLRCPDDSHSLSCFHILFNRDARMNTIANVITVNTTNIIQLIRSFAPNHENMLPAIPPTAQPAIADDSIMLMLPHP